MNYRCGLHSSTNSEPGVDEWRGLVEFVHKLRAWCGFLLDCVKILVVRLKDCGRSVVIINDRHEKPAL